MILAADHHFTQIKRIKMPEIFVVVVTVVVGGGGGDVLLLLLLLLVRLLMILVVLLLLLVSFLTFIGFFSKSSSTGNADHRSNCQFPDNHQHLSRRQFPGYHQQHLECPLLGK